MTEQTAQIEDILREDSGVDRSYRHSAKQVSPGETLETTASVLKWYEVRPEEQPVPDEIRGLARAYLSTHALDAHGFGFVVLHRCGHDFYFLIVSTWRGNNELWETVFYKDGERAADFSLFPREGEHKPTFCVWEMAAVQHEQQAWIQFLMSQRDARAAETWLGDCYEGPA